MSVVGASPPAPKNPDLILIDTDSLAQLLISGEVRLLRFIKKRFGIQPAIVEAVEVELRKSKKFRSQPQFAKELQKAIDNQSLFVLDSRTMPAFVSTSPDAVFNAIQTNGLTYEQRGLDYGEAYTFAAGVALDIPVVSNDMNAIRTAEKQNIRIPRYLLRTYDLIVLCHQIEELTVQDCDTIRKVLVSKNEFVPLAFQRTSFEKGLSNFYLRIYDSSKSEVGSANPISQYDLRILIVPRAT